MSILDEAVLSQLALDIGEETLPIVLQAFLAETKDRLETIKNLSAAQRWTELGKEGHTLKSTAGSFGLMELHLMAKAMDEACRHQNAERAMVLAAEIDILGQKSITTLETWLASKQV